LLESTSASGSISHVSRRRDKLAYFTAIALVVVLVVSVLVIQHLPKSPGNQSTSSIPPSESTREVSGNISLLVNGLDNLGNGNYTNVLRFYTNSSVLSIYGNTTDGGGAFNGNGTYIGLKSIKTIDSQSFAYLYPAPNVATISNLTTTADGPGNVNASYKLFVNATSWVYGMVNATMYIQQKWVNTNGSWVIANESWDFQSTWVQFQHF
jgi:hypothetical protein